jgi:DNA-binding PadR family transcriptional regulator
MLNPLETNGLLQSKKELQKSRVRKVYEITPKGKQFLHAHYVFLKEKINAHDLRGREK